MTDRVRIREPLQRVRLRDPLPAVVEIIEPRQQRFGEAGPGRPCGSRNLAPARVAKLVLDAMNDLGSDSKGEGGINGYLRHLLWNYPQFAGAMLHKMVPAQLSARVIEETSGTVQHQHEHVHRVDAEQLAHLSTDELARLHDEALRAPAASFQQSTGSVN
jgi:hypothetical protein